MYLAVSSVPCGVRWSIGDCVIVLTLIEVRSKCFCKVVVEAGDSSGGLCDLQHLRLLSGLQLVVLLEIDRFITKLPDREKVSSGIGGRHTIHIRRSNTAGVNRIDRDSRALQLFVGGRLHGIV